VTRVAGERIWSNNPTGYQYVWLRDSAPIPGATTSSYTVSSDDVGHDLACEITATNLAGGRADTADASFLSPPTEEEAAAIRKRGEEAAGVKARAEQAAAGPQKGGRGFGVWGEWGSRAAAEPPRESWRRCPRNRGKSNSPCG
jgi:hypothetical protein